MSRETLRVWGEVNIRVEEVKDPVTGKQMSRTEEGTGVGPNV